MSRSIPNPLNALSGARLVAVTLLALLLCAGCLPFEHHHQTHDHDHEHGHDHDHGARVPQDALGLHAAGTLKA